MLYSISRGGFTLTCPDSSVQLDADDHDATSEFVGTATSPQSEDDVRSFLQAQNAKGGVATTWTMAQAHQNLGHRNVEDILRIADQGMLPRIRLSSRTMSPCSACLTGTVNAHHAVSQHSHRATRPLERVYLDFFIPANENVIPERVAVVLYVLDEATT